MCGIYGTSLNYNDDILKRKMERIQFRGPDFSKFKHYIKGNLDLVLGHNRLSILDLDARSNQPFDFSLRTSITFNGEIYNYRELKSKYLSNVDFKTTGDTEVLCAMYEKYGEKCLQYLNGMFAFVIYDHQKNILFGARDRLGKKPLYYSLENNGVEFCSQISPIAIGRNFTISEKARQQFLYLNYIADPNTIYNEVNQLQAGHYFIYNLDSGKFEDYTYWDLFDNSCNYSKPKSYQEAKEFIKVLLLDSVKIRLQADVPVGVFLSGGIDSSLITSLVSQVNSSISCYTIGFHQKQYDESGYARRVAQALGVPLEVDFCDSNDALKILDDISFYYDEPFADYSLIPSSLVAEKAKKHVTVVLGGDGGDEFFWGYSWYPIMLGRSWQFSNLIIRSLLRMASCTKKEYRAKSSMFNCKNVYQAYSYMSKATYYGAEKYDVDKIVNSIPYVSFLNDERGALSFSDYDMKLFLNSDINTKTDRATMRCSLELRSPIMDYRIAEYCRLLPLDYLWDKKTGQKRILRDILCEYVPRNLFDRPKKGFTAPVGSWFRGELQDDLISVVNYEDLKNNIPEIDTDMIIKERDLFLLTNSNKYEIPLWRIYSYLKWVKSV